MNFICEPALQEYMQKKKRAAILVEEITSSNSDFEITELHIRLADERTAKLFKTKKRYYACQRESKRREGRTGFVYTKRRQ